MSKIYAESNAEGTARLFNKRFMYKMRSKRSVVGATNIIDFTIGERKLYGKVHHLYRPVFVKYQSRLKQLKNSAAREPMYAFNFVADLFNEMVLDFERCAAKGQINRDDPFLSSLKPYKAYQDPTLAYEEYKDIFFSSMREKFTNGSIMIENFDHFMEVFMESAVRVATNTPITFTSYIKSEFNTIMSSGLAIEISDATYDNDDDKVKMFLESKNWEFFVNACNKYGFIIDYNVPWRIVCDVKAPEIQPALTQYYPSVNEFFDFGFSRTSIEDLLAMPKLLLDFYHSVIKKSFKKQIICNGRVKTEVIKPPTYTTQQILIEKGFDYFIKIYMKLRMAEENFQMSKERQYFLMKDIIEYINLRDDVLAIENYFERYLSLPFDKTYSYTYNMNVVYEKLRKELQSGGATMSVSSAVQAMTGY